VSVVVVVTGGGGGGGSGGGGVGGGGGSSNNNNIVCVTRAYPRDGRSRWRRGQLGRVGDKSLVG